MKNTILNTLKREVKPAMGCTEPVAITLGVARAKDLIGDSKINKVIVKLCPNVFKNGLAVGLPGTGKYGHKYAVAVGLAGLEWRKGLSLYEDICPEMVDVADRIIEENLIEIEVKDTSDKINIEVLISSDEDSSRVIIKDSHDKFILIEKNGETIYQDEPSKECSNEANQSIFNYKIKDLIETIDSMEDKDLDFMYQGIEMNKKIAMEGIDRELGMGIGTSIKNNIDKGILSSDLITRAMMYTAGASDARMSGITMPVMSSNGSGNNGLTAILPIYAYTTMVELERIKINKSVAISHIINSYIKNAIGKLSPICGCGVAASTGSAVAIAWLMGADFSQIEGCINNMIGNTAGMICDGAKNGCAMKLSTSAAAAIQAVIVAMDGKSVSSIEGIVGASAEDTISNLGKLATEGMAFADKVIIDIMASK